MQIKNTQNRYGEVAIFLHWILALLLIFLVGYGLYMVRVPFSAHKLKLYGWHKEYGLLALLLVMARIVWRIGNITPALPDSLPHWQQIAARTVHWAFYFFMFS